MSFLKGFRTRSPRVDTKNEGRVDKYKAKFLAEQDALWDGCVRALRACYDQHPEDTAALMRHFDAVAEASFCPPSFDSTLGKLSYGWYGQDLVNAMWAVQHFVCHEVHDDGSPYLVWFAPEPVETEGMDKLRSLQARSRAPLRVVPKAEGRTFALLRDPGDVIVHREAVISCAEGSPLIEAALSAVALRAERDAKWAKFNGREIFVREPSPAQVFFHDLLREWEANK